MHLSPMNINHSVFFSFKSQILCYSSLQEVAFNTPPISMVTGDRLTKGSIVPLQWRNLEMERDPLQHPLPIFSLWKILIKK